MELWAENALLSAAKSSQSKSVRSDIRRIMQQIELTEIDLYRHQETDRLLDSILEANFEIPVVAILDDICQCFDLQYLAIFFIQNSIPTLSKKVVTNYPMDWVLEYLENRYFSVDPIIASAKTSEPFFWRDLDLSDPFAKNVFDRANQFGIGPNAFNCTIEIGAKRRFSVSFVGGNQAQSSFESKIEYYKSDLLKIAHRLCNSIYLNFDIAARQIELGDYHLGILWDILNGADIEEMRKIELPYGSFSANESHICRELGAKNLAQAALFAWHLDLIDRDRLSGSDLLVADTA